MTTQLTFPEVFDSSMLNSYKQCQYLFFLQYMNHWKPKGDNVHRRAGKAFAKGIETARKAVYLDGRDSETALGLGVAALIKEYGDFECPADSAKSVERMAGALEYYVENYPFEASAGEPVAFGGGRAIEVSFAYPLPIDHPETGNPILYCGRADAILAYGGSVLCTDEKTTTSLGPTWSRQWDLRAQFTGYAWGFRQSGFKIDGTLVRGISILKTKYDTQQAVVYHPDWQINRWYDETCDTLVEIIEKWKLGNWRHNLGDGCTAFGGCAFKQICTTENETPWLETYFERKRWNPLTREDEHK